VSDAEPWRYGAARLRPLAWRERSLARTPGIMLEFDHVGITTTVVQPDENWVEQSRVWVTNPRNSPHHIEFLRYEPDSTVPDAIKNNPHIAFRVDKLEPNLVDAEILIPPFIVGDFLEVVFVRKHNTIFEYMRYLKDGWFDQK
jgi:hypothetical protein